jgi:four helix bundle protein
VIAKFEELRVLKTAEELADEIWKLVVQWDDFAKDTVGKQFARAADSIGANLAEAFGRFHYGERLQFLYFARGSLFESKYWLNRAISRNLIATDRPQNFANRLSELARQLNAFAAHVKSLRNAETKQPKALRETASEYWTDIPDDFPPDSLFTDIELLWLESQ